MNGLLAIIFGLVFLGAIFGAIVCFILAWNLREFKKAATTYLVIAISCVLVIGAFGVYALSNSSGNKFTNKFGTETTKCYEAGCDNYIASSGDTNCCVEHSNRCAYCNCYIDGDAFVCMDCLYDAVGE